MSAAAMFLIFVASDPTGWPDDMAISGPMPAEVCESQKEMLKLTQSVPPGYTTTISCGTRDQANKAVEVFNCKMVDSDRDAKSFVDTWGYKCSKRKS